MNIHTPDLVIGAALVAALIGGCSAPAAGPASDGPAPTATIPTSVPENSPVRSAQPGDVIVADPGSVPGDDEIIAPGDVAADGQVAVVMSFTGRNDGRSTLTTYDTAGSTLAREPDNTGYDRTSGHIVTRRADGIDLLLTMQEVETPARGVRPASTAWTLTGWNARTLTPLWAAPITPRPDDIPPFELVQNTVHPSQDGRWLVDTFASPPVVVDEATGSVARSQPDATAMVGNSLLVVPQEDGDSGTAVARFVDPGTGNVTGTTTAPPLVRDVGTGKSPSNVVATDPGAPNVITTDEDGSVIAVDLPGGGPGWRTRIPPGDGIPSVETGDSGIALVHTDHTVFGLDETTGRILWSQKVDTVCGASDGRAAAVANEQLVTLDMKSGQQLTYDAATGVCPTILPGGLSVADGGNGPITRYW